MPGQNPTGFYMAKKELYRGQALGDIRAIAAGPSGDYLLVIHGDGPVTLSKMGVPSGQPITTVYTSTTVPHLGGERLSLFPRVHAQDGLVWTLEAMDVNWAGQWTMFYDSNQNGTITSWVTLDMAQYEARYTHNAHDPAWLWGHVFGDYYSN